jgi:hypothetical protein
MWSCQILICEIVTYASLKHNGHASSADMTKILWVQCICHSRILGLEPKRTVFYLQVARCTKIINPNTDDAKYVINVKQIAKFVVGLGDKVRTGTVAAIEGHACSLDHAL